MHFHCFFFLQALMEVGDSVTSMLQKLLIKKVLVALKLAVPDEVENVEERVLSIIQSVTEVCTIRVDVRKSFCDMVTLSIPVAWS